MFYLIFISHFCQNQQVFFACSQCRFFWPGSFASNAKICYNVKNIEKGVLANSPKGRAFGSPRKLHLFAKASPFGRAGFVIDGFYEECFKTNKEIPMVMIVRLKKAGANSPSLAALDSPLWDGAFGSTAKFPAKVQSLRHARGSRRRVDYTRNERVGIHNGTQKRTRFLP